MTDWLAKGATAPEFSLKADDGSTVSLVDLKGRFVVLYFYPKDDTPGCTTQACNFRDRLGEFTALGAVVLGVSPDDASSHAAFRAKHRLNFPLLIDPGNEVAKKYGAWREKNMYGKKSIGIQRSTYLIDGAGKIAAVWKKVSVEGHDQQILDSVRVIAGK